MLEFPNNVQRVHIKRGMEIIHIETPLGIVNIHLNLKDSRGRRVESVTMIPNFTAAVRPPVKLIGRRFVELKRKG